MSPSPGEAGQRSTGKHTNGSKSLSPVEQAKPAAQPAQPAQAVQPAQAAQAAQATRAASSPQHVRPNMMGPAPLNSSSPSHNTQYSPSVSILHQTSNAGLPTQRSISMALAHQRGAEEESPVMNETLSVIDEHITDLNTPRSSLLATDRRGANDSGSDYGSHIDHRLSYIAGNETDEEERDLHTRKQVLTWSPDQVSDCLTELGVEPRHCEVFREQEITGEVLLSMDQASVFMKDFDLGLVGRRLRTWHKIKGFQDEVRANDSSSKRTPDSFSAQGSTEELRSGRVKGLANGPSLPQIPSFNDRALFAAGQSPQDMRSPQISPPPSPSLQHTQSPRIEASSTPASFSTFTSGPDSPRRPSAASVREYNHSRRHSAVDFSPSMRAAASFDRSSLTIPPRTTTSPHKKAPSLDRNWTMGSPIPAASARPMSAITHSTPFSNERNAQNLTMSKSSNTLTTAMDLERGYLSGGEAEPKRARNVLRKRDVASANHSRQSSNLEDHPRVIPGSKRHSRFGSVDSIRDTVAAMAAPAAKLYPGSSAKGKMRSSTANDIGAPLSSPSNEVTSPTVTKLEYDQKPRMSQVTRTSSPKVRNDDYSNESSFSLAAMSKSSQVAAKPRIGLRAISDAVTGSEKAIAGSPSPIPSPIKAPSVQSPTRTGSTTPSGASHSFDLESTDASSKGTSGAPTGLTPTSGTTRRKTKKDTSAYVRGLEQKTPLEQMIGCDYSGWMKKKSSNLMKTWKPRLFVLRGRRLSYYYSENDTQEKGLIDISFHRVLPADHDIITGIHATVTGAKSSPVSPSNAQTTTLAAVEAAAAPESTLQKPAGDNMFIFKLVPPRSGLSRAVNFTKPTVHYFAVENVVQGRLWMAALVKATIDRDETKPITTTYQQKTISLFKARALRHRPPALMGLDEKQVDEGPKSDETGLNIQGVDLKYKRTGSLSVEPSSRTMTDSPETSQERIP